MQELIYFVLGSFFFLFLPGRLIINLTKHKFSDIENVIYSLAVSIPFLTFTSYVLGYLQLQILLLPILIFMDLALIFIYKWRPALNSLKINKLVVGVVFLGVFIQSLYMVKSGLNINGGISFWGVHGYDGVFHLALINEMVNHFPPQNPGFSGELLKNYHFLTDLFYAQFSRITFVSPINLYFRFGPILISMLLNSLIYLLAKKMTGKISSGLWTIFFVSVVGSFGWIPPFFGKGSNNWETAFWSIQTPSSLLNPPFAFSLMILTLVAILLFEKEKKFNLIILLAFLSGLLFGFKIYAGLILFCALGLISLWQIIKKDFSFLLILLLAIPFAFAVFLPTSSGASGFLIWEPWWFIKTMVEAPDRLNWPGLELRRQVYVAANNISSLFILQGFLFTIFFIGNLGTRFIGVISIIQKIFKRSLLDVFLIMILTIALLPPIFFVQKSLPWNAIQFNYYFVFFFSFFAGSSMVWVLSKLKHKFIQIIFALIVISLSLPSTLETLYWFNAPTPTTLLEAKELEGLNFLKLNSPKDSIVLTYPFYSGNAKKFNQPPVPMTYYNSPYVSFFSEHRVYLEDLNAANLMGYPYEERLKKEEEFLKTTDVKIARDFLKNNNISFVYFADKQDLVADKKQIGLEEIFNNEKVRIYRLSGTI